MALYSTATLTAVFKKVPEGYIGYVEELPGANTQGETLEEARVNLREAVELVVAANRELARADGDDADVIREDGHRDRIVTLPRPLLGRLRQHWKHHRPAASSSHVFISPRSGAPLDPTTLQKTVIAARRDLALSKHATVHTLRHSYATSPKPPARRCKRSSTS